MKLKDQFSFFKHTLFILFLAVTVLLGMVFLVIIPVLTEKMAIDQEAELLEARIKEQKVLTPLYAGLKDLAGRSQDSKSKIPLDNDIKAVNIDTVSTILNTMANEAGLGSGSFNPVPDSLTDSSKFLVHGKLNGAYQNFQLFLIELISIENFRHLELLEIKATPDGPEFTISAWFELQ